MREVNATRAQGAEHMAPSKALCTWAMVIYSGRSA